LGTTILKDNESRIVWFCPTRMGISEILTELSKAFCLLVKKGHTVKGAA
jgi:hypothetical protein